MEIQYTFLASSPRSSVCGNVVKFLRGHLAYSGDFGHFRSKATLATSMIYKWTQSSQVFGIFSHGSPSHINLVGVVHQPIQNSICDSWTADYIMPLINRHLKIRLSPKRILYRSSTTSKMPLLSGSERAFMPQSSMARTEVLASLFKSFT